jgi:hypothetical protein
MQKNIILSIIFSVVSSLVYSQDNEHKLYSKFQDIVYLKIAYEKYQYLSRSYPADSITLKVNSLHEQYKAHVDEVKKSPEIYLKYIKEQLRNKDTVSLNLRVLYKFLNFNDPSVMNYRTPYHYIKKNDLLKIVKYSFFDRNDDLLPEDFRGLPIIDIGDYNGYNEIKKGEFAKAVRFILKKIPLNKEEMTFVKSKQNPKSVVDIKKYLDKNGLNKESEEFIDWALEHLIADKDAKLSLAILEMNYLIIK